MDIESLVESVMSEVYHAAVQHPDPIVQERIVKSNAYNMIEDFLKDYREAVWSEFRDAHPEVEA